MTTRILDVRSLPLPRQRGGHEPFINIQWMSVLRSLTAYQMLPRHVRSRVSGPGVLRFLLQNREFPRSVMSAVGDRRDPALSARQPPHRTRDRTQPRTGARRNIEP